VSTDEPDLAFIRRCVAEGKLVWTYHINMRLREHAISRPMVLDSVGSYCIIEQYPDDQRSRYLPCCLVRAEFASEVLHILFAMDRQGDSVTVVTVYRPDPARWDSDFKQRKQP
jgi:hypothetical protein